MEAFFISVFEQFSFIADFTNGNAWVWPIAEVFHFLGLTLLVGAIGVLDLRLLGVARGLEPAATHQLVPIGVVGFCLSALSGLTFVGTNPAMFIENPVFQLKMLFVFLAGVNVVFFYVTVFRSTESTAAGEHVSPGAKVVGGLSILLWMGVIITGRFMAWF